jgi:hypothetical protein
LGSALTGTTSQHAPEAYARVGQPAATARRALPSDSVAAQHPD